MRLEQDVVHWCTPPPVKCGSSGLSFGLSGPRLPSRPSELGRVRRRPLGSRFLPASRAPSIRLCCRAGPLASRKPTVVPSGQRRCVLPLHVSSVTNICGTSVRALGASAVRYVRYVPSTACCAARRPQSVGPIIDTSWHALRRCRSGAHTHNTDCSRHHAVFEAHRDQLNPQQLPLVLQSAGELAPVATISEA